MACIISVVLFIRNLSACHSGAVSHPKGAKSLKNEITCLNPEFELKLDLF